MFVEAWIFALEDNIPEWTLSLCSRLFAFLQALTMLRISFKVAPCSRNSSTYGCHQFFEIIPYFFFMQRFLFMRRPGANKLECHYHLKILLPNRFVHHFRNISV
jgi:hypothetical protein